MKRVLLLLAVGGLVIGGFAFGLFTANYKTFPWTVMQPAGKQLAEALRDAGLLPPIGPVEPVYDPSTRRQVKLVATGLVNFDFVTVNNGNGIEGHAGGMAVVPGGVLIARRRDGLLTFFDRAADDIRTLPFALPRLEDNLPESFDFGGKASPGFVFRYHDIELVKRSDGEQLYVSYNFYDPVSMCFTIRLDRAELPAGWETATEGTLEWRRVLETSPCLPPSPIRNTFGGNQAGGRIVAAPQGGIYFTVGDFEYDGDGGKDPAVSQLDGSTYGRILHVAEDDTVTEISRGHRNPQGLTLDGTGRIWTTDQAPMGGDELNIVRPGSNHGWPTVTLGVQYVDPASDTKMWSSNPRQGRHDGFAAPRYAWMPSVAPSSIALIQGISPRWDGDLLVGTLAGLALRRLRMDGDRVLYDERIPLEQRVRDVAVADGRIYLLFDEDLFGYLTPHDMAEPTAASADRSVLASLRCTECHSNPSAPRLAAVHGAPIAAQDGVAYSAALQAVEGVWTDETLTQFLTSPGAFAPGTTMPEVDLDAQQVTAAVRELRALAVAP